MNALEKIYYNLHVLEDDMIELPEARKSCKNIMEYLMEKGFLKREPKDKQFFEVEDFVENVAAEHEKQGFCLGFSYAVKLFTSVWGGIK